MPAPRVGSRVANGPSSLTDAWTGPFARSAHEGSIAACTRIRGTVFPVEASYAIGTGFQFQIDVRIRHLIACRPVADHEEDGIFLREIQEMMAIACSSWKADAGARPNGFAAGVGHKHELALDHVNELVLPGMRVSRRRLTSGQNPNKIDAVILEPCMIAEAPGTALALSLPERLGIAGCVA